MKILHTSDWHIGCTLYDHRRLDEHEKFLDWLCNLVEREGIEAVVVAGDIFDSSTPSNQMETMFSSFCTRMRASGVCRTLVVTGGNHDSPSQLNIFASYMRKDNNFIFGRADKEQEEHILVLRGADGRPGAILCAVPYLGRDVRIWAPDEEASHEVQAYRGIKAYYASIAEKAEALRERMGEEGKGVPIMATGHLFVSGAKRSDGEGDIIVGTLADVGTDVFPKTFSYVALGHIHTSQMFEGGRIRYSGSPLPIDFGEWSSEVVLKEGEAKTWPLHGGSLSGQELARQAWLKGEKAQMQDALARVAKQLEEKTAALQKNAGAPQDDLDNPEEDVEDLTERRKSLAAGLGSLATLRFGARKSCLLVDTDKVASDGTLMEGFARKVEVPSFRQLLQLSGRKTGMLKKVVKELAGLYPGALVSVDSGELFEGDVYAQLSEVAEAEARKLGVERIWIVCGKRIDARDADSERDRPLDGDLREYTPLDIFKMLLQSDSKRDLEMDGEMLELFNEAALKAQANPDDLAE